MSTRTELKVGKCEKFKMYVGKKWQEVSLEELWSGDLS